MINFKYTTKEEIEQWLVIRKLRKQMRHVLKVGYGVEFSKLSKEKVFGRTAEQRLLDCYIICFSRYSFAEFHEMVKPIARNEDAVKAHWIEVLDFKGELR